MLPCFIGFGHVGFLVNFAFALMLVRLGLVLKHYQLFSKWELFKALFNRLAWLSFSTIFVGYWVLEQMQVEDETEGGLVGWLKNMGQGSIWIVVIGAAV